MHEMAVLPVLCDGEASVRSADVSDQPQAFQTIT
jgi:hypothetical protein